MELTLQNQTKVALIDDEDFELVKPYKWYLMYQNGREKAVAAVLYGTSLYLHRLLLGEPDGLVDHKNRDVKDNHKTNLRITNAQGNNQNRGPLPGSSSKYKGVTKVGNKFMAQIKVGKKNHYLGLFEYEINAARAFDKKAKELSGDMAYLNFPLEKVVDS